jgi:lipopolysaccharide export system permease protein
MLMFGILDRYIGRTVIMAIMMCTITLVGLSSLIKFVDQLQNVGEGNFTTLHAILRVIYASKGAVAAITAYFLNSSVSQRTM